MGVGRGHSGKGGEEKEFFKKLSRFCVFGFQDVMEEGEIIEETGRDQR